MFRPEGTPVINLNRPQEVTRDDQPAQLDLLAKLNQRHLAAHPGEAELAGRIESFELAYRMQMEASELVDFSTESAQTRALYGINEKETRSYGAKCLMAKRLVERGIRS